MHMGLHMAKHGMCVEYNYLEQYPGKITKETCKTLPKRGTNCKPLNRSEKGSAMQQSPAHARGKRKHVASEKLLKLSSTMHNTPYISVL